ncbi:unnamed protein product [Schistosoma margrebowiei]|uniref:DUF7041 domain-containing protein n=1 Tax=Schistosoma margrebowiei TaxID=48269 RepID=A0A183MD01_9TREM|nr:unnamed protein product [Schistosoma margrebowiei]
MTSDVSFQSNFTALISSLWFYTFDKPLPSSENHLSNGHVYTSPVFPCEISNQVRKSAPDIDGDSIYDVPKNKVISRMPLSDQPTDLKETHNLEDLSPVEIDTVMTTKSRLPEFDRSDPELWFAQLEHYFTRHNIKSEGIRYRDLCFILPPSVAKEVRDLILDPPSPQPYTILRRTVYHYQIVKESKDFFIVKH